MFFQFTDREQTSGHLLVAKGVEEITLIFIAIDATEHLCAAIAIVAAAHIVAHGDVIGV